MDRNPIHPPPPARNDYEIKPQIIALVRQNQFNGLPAEHPLDHIENFEEICSTTRSNGVSADYLKCKLFSFSLGDKASRWLKSLPAHSITTWDEYKAAFINHFYTNKINFCEKQDLHFRQGNNESFYEALDRFKEYIRDCPNHGFNEGNLWNIFYRGIDHKYKLSLDTASNGNFMTKTVDEAKVLIENLAASDCNNCPDYDRSSRTTTSSPDSFQMTELKNMMAQVLKGQLKHINAIEGMSDANEDSSRECMGDFSNEANEEDVNYIGNYGNKGYNPSYRPNPNMSYRNPNVENPQDQVYPPRYPQQQRPPYQSQGSQFQPRQGYEQRSSYPPKEPYASSPNQAPPNQQGGRFEGILQQIMDGQKRNTKEMYEKMDTLFSNLNTKYDAVATHVKKLETQVTQTMEAVKRQEAESKKSFCNSAAIEERFEDQVPEWMLSKPTVDCMIWPEENYPERESNRARKRRLFPKIIPKTDNSGKFVVPCIIKGNILEQSLCDTGANVNIMSKRIADKIGLTKIEPSSISINYADSFSQTPYGFVPNVMVQIGNCSIPTDFQIVEMRESSHRPLIFGTPFLSTVGAIFDFPNQRISFNKVNKGMFFPMCSTKNSFVDMVQEEKATLKPPQEGETEETIKEDPIPKPKQLAKQARSKTKAPTPKPPKGSTKIEDEAKPRRKVRKPRSGRNMKLLFPEELIDENLEGFKERVTRTLKLFPKAVVPRDIHGEIVYPAVNHPPDTHCKEKRLGGSRCLLSLSSPERQALQSS
ncbi:unnamed protein product [Microthlaspi erraticum]|uniref:Retrotransposon gag domain-containing protein n=1 Tax=Microthlaspi erraticum TaxID=1685480 RepID=A0A6D2KSQ6_9BRAS|nr:unnamed protein product [Microthlaspi erraticum]